MSSQDVEDARADGRLHDCVSISFGIVVYRSDPRRFEELLRSLVHALKTLDANVSVVATAYIVFNDDSVERNGENLNLLAAIDRDSPSWLRIETLSGHGNIGYGAGQNLATANSQAEYHVILNPDVVIDEAAILESVRFLRDRSEAVMVVPQAFDSGNRYACLAKRDPSLLVLLLRALSVGVSQGVFGRRVGRYVYSDKLPSESPETVAHASGCFMCCRMSALKNVGGFDDRYFLYFEDYDLSKRLSREGHIYELPNVRIRHAGGHTIRRGWKRVGYFVQSARRFFSQYGWRIA